ncbi:SPOR domain-containing protein [Gilvimarinus agarilyticus]|uniref:SPOR domain-containing protein n=1 Tax=unclassified Gilvimarinus TaxID=2642066 RepID=UPI001C0886B6|nr:MULTISPECIES: SPOR domain-containing protein [unclassified Gilvimarinus]MBU2884556.1 SPOR domain-containing protein [Gilvimarinus agarilyticus]MDO6569681.1 SPOR domain-containing protein [Gilvimarinus sp. 2_MG-2023]MDO6748626.1 SPOR domain-containing protein [Gilvimarinus sp. 1_MG-2023]
MRLIFFALLGVNVAVLVLQLTVWSAEEAVAVQSAPVSSGGEALRLLSEGERSTQVSRSSEAARATVEASVPKEGLCDMVGPFERLLRAEYFVEALQALSVTATVKALEVPEGKGYWVHLPPESSKKEALGRLREVQAKQIDSYLIPKGDLANGISFGMFTRQELALAKLDEMQTLGYEAEIREITRTRKENWVVLGAGQAQKMSNERWLELISRENNVEKQQKYCSGVASE